jgi:hypothetical protein
LVIQQEFSSHDDDAPGVPEASRKNISQAVLPFSAPICAICGK